MKVMRIVPVVICACLLGSPACADFSYSLQVANHSIIVTGLGNGEFFLKLDRKLYKPEMLPKESIYTQQVKPRRQINVRTKGYLVAVDDNGRGFMIEKERSSDWELLIEVFPASRKVRTDLLPKFGSVAGRTVFFTEAAVSEDQAMYMFDALSESVTVQ